MKKIVVAIVFLFVVITAQAQKITVYEVNETFSNGTNPAYSVDIYENSLDEVRSACWKKTNYCRKSAYARAFAKPCARLCNYRRPRLSPRKTYSCFYGG